MDEIKFKKFENIKNYRIRFKCFTDDRDGYQATFHIYDKSNPKIHYHVNFEISNTQYNSDFNNTGKLIKNYINDNFKDIENCFKQIGIKYLKEKITINELENKNISLIKHLFKH